MLTKKQVEEALQEAISDTGVCQSVSQTIDTAMTLLETLGITVEPDSEEEEFSGDLFKQKWQLSNQKGSVWAGRPGDMSSPRVIDLSIADAEKNYSGDLSPRELMAYVVKLHNERIENADKS